MSPQGRCATFLIDVKKINVCPDGGWRMACRRSRRRGQRRRSGTCGWGPLRPSLRRGRHRRAPHQVTQLSAPLRCLRPPMRPHRLRAWHGRLQPTSLAAPLLQLPSSRLRLRMVLLGDWQMHSMPWRLPRCRTTLHQPASQSLRQSRLSCPQRQSRRKPCQCQEMGARRCPASKPTALESHHLRCSRQAVRLSMQ